MAIKNIGSRTLFEAAIPATKGYDKLLSTVNEKVNWEPIRELLDKSYSKGKSDRGRPAYPPILLFKAILIQTFNSLSDVQLEKKLNNDLSYMNFCGFSFYEPAPDHSIISRFKSELAKKNIFDKLLAIINNQLEEEGIIVKTGTIIDGSFTHSQRTKNKKKAVESPPSSQKDLEADWVKKGNKYFHGYKRHYATDHIHGLVLSVSTSPASVHDTHYFDELLDKLDLEEESIVCADKGYSSKKNEDSLKKRNLLNCIQKKAKRNHPLTKEEHSDNASISRTFRYKVERVFGSIKRWFNGHTCRYVGQVRTHGQHVLEAIAYNLYRYASLGNN